MIIKLQKQSFISAKEKGQIFFFEILFGCLLLAVFVFAYMHINVEDKTNETMKYFKVQDIITIVEAKQIFDLNEVKQITDFYLPNAKTTGKNCIVKDTNVWESKEGTPQKHKITVKVCY